MIVRIVVMYFDEGEVDSFLCLFARHRKAIADVAGCSRLRLLKNIRTPNSYVTWSHWDSPQSLEAYRHSSLFTSLWAKVKPLFSSPPKAYSLMHENGDV